MKKLLFILIAFFAYSFSVSANDYSINEIAVDQMFSQADEITVTDFTKLLLENSSTMLQGNKNAWIALILNTVPFVTTFLFVPVFGLHRIYLGTSTGVFVTYLCTAGGCGIIQAVDWVVLLIAAIDGDVSKYENHNGIFMW